MYTAIIDACVLAQPLLRDVILSLAAEDVFVVKWSNSILEELKRTILNQDAKKGIKEEDTNRYIDFLFARMEEMFPDANTEANYSYNPGLPDSDIPDLNDLHVVGAAIGSNANVIVTLNLKHFPNRILPPNLAVQSPGEFLLHTYTLYKVQVSNALCKMFLRQYKSACNTGRGCTFEELVEKRLNQLRKTDCLIPFIDRVQSQIL